MRRTDVIAVYRASFGLLTLQSVLIDAYEQVDPFGKATRSDWPRPSYATDTAQGVRRAAPPG